MEFWEVIAGYRRVHVMLDVVVHVPVEKLKEGIQANRAGTEPKVWDVIPQTAVLCNVHEVHQPTTNKDGRGDYKR